MNYVLAITFIIVALIIEGILVFLKPKPKWAACLTFCASLITQLFSFVTLQVPAPEIYPSNGQVSKEGIVRITSEPGLSIYYTLDPYVDPAENGVKYTGPLYLEESTTMNAKACLGDQWSSKWSEAVTLDLVIGKKGEIKAADVEEPGSSLMSISAELNTELFYEGGVLLEKDFEVEGQCINGSIIPIEHFSISPSVLSVGENDIAIGYGEFTTNITVNAVARKIDKLEAYFIGDEMYVGDKYEKSQFMVKGIFNDGCEEVLTDFLISPKYASKEGEESVTISVGEAETMVRVQIWKEEDASKLNGLSENDKKEDTVHLFSNCYEEHDPDGILPQISFGYWEDGKVDVQGQGHEGDLYLFMGDMYNMIQPAGDGNVTVTLHFIVNPKYDLTQGAHISGSFVVDGETMGSDAYTTASIYMDGREEWGSGEMITGSTVKPVPFEVDVVNGTAEMTMVFQCNALAEGLGLGILFTEVN